MKLNVLVSVPVNRLSCPSVVPPKDRAEIILYVAASAKRDHVPAGVVHFLPKPFVVTTPPSLPSASIISWTVIVVLLVVLLTELEVITARVFGCAIYWPAVIKVTCLRRKRSGM